MSGYGIKMPKVKTQLYFSDRMGRDLQKWEFQQSTGRVHTKTTRKQNEKNIESLLNIQYTIGKENYLLASLYNGMQTA